MKKKTIASVPVLVRLPPPLLKKLDSACKKQGHSRTFEMCIRLGESFDAVSSKKAAA